MKSMLLFSMLFIFYEQVTPLQAQSLPAVRNHAISVPQFFKNDLQPLEATGTLNLVAIMVEFQPDNDRLTTGTGIFGSDGMEGLPFLSRAEDVRIEPLPHNQSYFEAHLEFAKNYFERTSDGQLTINYQVLPEIYRLPSNMSEYSPTGETFTYEKLALLVQDAWQQVENGPNFNDSGLDPENTAFVIFHAGVGRDIELTGTNLDITPLDIPSIYLRKNDLGDLLGENNFDGFPVNDGNFRVTNSMIIPRTESRRGLDIQDNEFVLPLSINGLLVASIASYLGLPDLFNTETGEPGIGRFGLMDGAGFFAYNGLLPPEPSAWEKTYLGWETPFEVDIESNAPIDLPAASLSSPNSIARISLSGSEYFLVENRHRDPQDNGLTLTIQTPEGSLVQQTFTNEDEDFVFQQEGFEKLLEAGVVVDASNFDFSLPGGLDTGQNTNNSQDDRYLNGGMLIWHIDERVISQNLNSGTVNADPERRGIDLEEADGAQDIGYQIPGALNNNASFGTAFDFWWSGNDYRVILQTGSEISLYENRFGPDTQPNNDSNSGSPSFFELYDFSDNLAVSSFSIKRVAPFEDRYTSGLNMQLDSESDYFTSNDPYYTYYPLSLSIYETQSDTFLVVPSPSGAYAVNISSPNQNVIQLTDTPVQQPYVGDHLILADKPEIGNPDIDVAALTWNSFSNTFDTTWTATVPANRGFLSSQSDQVLHADHTNTGIDLTDGSVLALQSDPFQRSLIVGGEYAEITNSVLSFSSDPSVNIQLGGNNYREYIGSIELGDQVLFLLMQNDIFSLIDPNAADLTTTIFEGTDIEWPAITENASSYFIDRQSNQLIGLNRLSGFEPNTPIPAPDGVQFVGTPLLTQFSDTEETTFFVTGQSENSLDLFAYDSQGNLLEGFPLYVGASLGSDLQPIHPIIHNDELFSISHDGNLRSWKLNDILKAEWKSRYGDFRFNKYSAVVQESDNNSGNSYGVLKKSETYNWPNPADDFTNLRFQIASPGGSVEITIITTSGQIIFENTYSSAGGFPEEIEINTGNWSSGGYIARVKATVGGKTDTKIYKIGIVH
ncbi:MAG: hypothetical protein U5K71_00190 [Gracilimonas sp.]|nr:hypothetical protein [Gracilimonas sp.]